MREKAGAIIIAHVDHLTGEELGWAMEAFNVPGVRSRNIVPTVTKKGRPGYIFVLDIVPDKEAEIAELLAKNLSVYGYHYVQTVHKHMSTSIREENVTISHRGRSLTATVGLKTSGELDGFAAMESDDLLDISTQIRDQLGAYISPLELKSRIRQALPLSDETGIFIEL